MPKTKAKPVQPTGKAAPILELPEHVKVSEAELAVLSRLVRVMRQKDDRGAPWLGPFIEWLLYRDATEPNLNYQSSSDVSEALTRMGANDGLLGSGSRFIKAARRECPGISFVSATSAAQPKEGKPTWSAVMLPPDEEDQFYEILRLWRKEYPEPPKRPEVPKGRTQHEMDPDSD
jgi:hypothetical protein